MPTIIVGENSGDDFSGVADNSLEQSGPTNNYGGYSAILLGDTYKYYMLIKFTGLSSISSPPVTVSSAVMSLYYYESETSRSITLRGLLRDWIEGTLSGDNRSGNTPYSSCYNEYGSGNAWSTAGALSDGNDRDASSCGTIALSATYGYRQSTDMSAITEDWINGDRSNYGVHGTLGTTGAYPRLRSSEGTDGQRPYLTVTYTESGGASGHPTASRFRLMSNNNVRYA